MNRETSYARKLGILRALLAKEEKAWLRLTSQRSLAWLTGMRSFINLAAVEGCAQVYLSADEVVLLANHIEARRLMEEELHDVPIELEEYPWYQPESRLTRWTDVQAEDILTEDEVADFLLYQQSVLDEHEQETLSRLAQETAMCVESVAKELQPGDTEFQVAGRMAQRFWAAGLEPIVLLVAADARAFLRRHPLPSRQSIENYAVLVACGRRNGLVASVTRAVHFGPLPDTLHIRQRIAAHVDAAAIAASQPGRTLGDVMAVIQQTYQDYGWSDEWKEHHQGGLTGYLSRTRLARPGDDFVLQADMAVAWNPSVAGAKSEDTVLITPREPEILSISANRDWPSQKVAVGPGTFFRPQILVRSR